MVVDKLDQSGLVDLLEGDVFHRTKEFQRYPCREACDIDLLWCLSLSHNDIRVDVAGDLRADYSDNPSLLSCQGVLN